jgi:hypothetical protein
MKIPHIRTCGDGAPHGLIEKLGDGTAPSHATEATIAPRMAPPAGHGAARAAHLLRSAGGARLSASLLPPCCRDVTVHPSN